MWLLFRDIYVLFTVPNGQLGHKVYSEWFMFDLSAPQLTDVFIQGGYTMVCCISCKDLYSTSQCFEACWTQLVLLSVSGRTFRKLLIRHSPQNSFSCVRKTLRSPYVLTDSLISAYTTILLCCSLWLLDSFGPHRESVNSFLVTWRTHDISERILCVFWSP